MRNALVAGLALFPFAGPAAGQNFVRDLAGIAFFRDQVPYREPLSGGLNAPMQQFADLDGDGDLDLFILDSDFYAERYYFRNVGDAGAPVFSLEPEGGFRGAAFSYWFRFVDFDADGIVDLLTDDGSSGVRVWRNDATPADPSWSVRLNDLRDTSGAPLFAGFGGLPGIADMTGDGLPDFLSGNSADGSFNYYRNTGIAGVPAYALVSTRLSDITITGDTCTQGGAGLPAADKNPAHGLGAVALSDLDGNGTTDLVYGDLFSHSLFHLRNAGTAQDPALECASNVFPPDGSLSTVGFNQASFADIDADGDPDLFVGVLNSRTRNSFWHYENNGTPGAPAYTLVTRDFAATLDVGQNAAPALADLDGDLDLDLVIGNNDGQLWHFRNEGSPLSPLFHLVDTAFAGITGNYSYAPAFADLDDDGDPDLLLGRFDGRVIVYRNAGPGGFQPVDTIVTGQYAVPAAADVDGDGDPDLVVGKGNGTLSFYRNSGDASTFVPDLVSETFLGRDFGSNARPAFRWNAATGRADLYVAPAAGDTAPGGRSLIVAYSNTGSGGDTPYALDNDRFGPGMPYEPAIAFTDLDGDGDDDLLVGTSKGGLVYYRNDGGTGVEEARRHPGEFRLTRNFPNPFNATTVIGVELSSPGWVGVEFFDVHGSRVGRIGGEQRGPGFHRIPWSPTGLPSGVYYCRVTVDGRRDFIKTLLIK